MNRDIKVLQRILRKLDTALHMKNWPRIRVHSEMFTRCWDAVVNDLMEQDYAANRRQLSENQENHTDHNDLGTEEVDSGEVLPVSPGEKGGGDLPQ